MLQPARLEGEEENPLPWVPPLQLQHPSATRTSICQVPSPAAATADGQGQAAAGPAADAAPQAPGHPAGSVAEQVSGWLGGIMGPDASNLVGTGVVLEQVRRLLCMQLIPLADTAW